MKKVIAIICIISLGLLISGCHHKPHPKKRVWVPKHIKPNGVVVPGHWKRR